MQLVFNDSKSLVMLVFGGESGGKTRETAGSRSRERQRQDATFGDY
jgi:hypothetical protein